MLLAAVLVQSGLGAVAHKTPYSPVAGSSRAGSRVAHILLGVTVLALSWVQIRLGFGEYEQRRERAKVLDVVFWL